jgi:hypothetical protein
MFRRTYKPRQPLGRDNELGQVESLGGVVQEGRQPRKTSNHSVLCGFRCSMRSQLSCSIFCVPKFDWGEIRRSYCNGETGVDVNGYAWM